ncbi:MAG: DISARM system-associated protein DrmE [Clostridia bacterium]|nr:DISARM system-associated protein DrmE [Clostridia bacterium]
MSKFERTISINDIKYLDNNLSLKDEEYIILENFIKAITKNKRIMVSYPNQKLFFILVLRLLHLDYDLLYQNRSDPLRRVSLLLITSLKEAYNVFENLSIASKYVIDNSVSKQQYFATRNDIWTNMSNDFYAHIYWKDNLNKRFNQSIPDYLNYKSIFPISVGFNTFKNMPRNYLGKYDNSQQSTIYVTSNINIFNKKELPLFDYIFIDYSNTNKYIKNIPSDTKTVFYFNKLLDDRVLYIKNKIDKFALINHTKLQECSNKGLFLVNSKKLESKYSMNNLRIEYVESSFEESIYNAINMLEQADNYKELEYEKKIVSILISSILSLPITAIEYDQVAYNIPFYDTNLDLLNEVKRSININESSEMVKCVQNIEDVFNKHELDTYCPKKEKLFQEIKFALKKNKKILIITKNKISNIALKASISDNFLIDIPNLEEEGIVVKTLMSLKKIDYIDNIDLLILTSCNNMTQINILNDLEYEKAILLVYKYEINNLRKRLEDVYEIFCSNNSKIIDLYNSNNSIDNMNLVYKYLLNRIKNTSCKREDNSGFSLDNIINMAINNIRPRNVIYTGKDAVDAVTINFFDGSYCFAELDGMVRILSATKSDIVYEKVENLEQKDNLVFIDGEMRNDLYDLIINHLNKTDKLFVSNILVKQWHEKLEDVVVHKKISYVGIYKEMKRLGWKKKSSHTIKYWIKGYSMGPNKARDIKILGEVLNIQDFVENASYYFDAMQYVRRTRRLVARYLNNLIIESNRITKRNIKDSKKIEMVGLNMDDLQEAVQVKEIYSIDLTYKKIKPSDIGKCYLDQ